MLYKAFILALGQDHLVFSKSLKYEIVDSFWFLRAIFFKAADRGNLSILMYYMPQCIQCNEHIGNRGH